MELVFIRKILALQRNEIFIDETSLCIVWDIVRGIEYVACLLINTASRVGVTVNVIRIPIAINVHDRAFRLYQAAVRDRMRIPNTPECVLSSRANANVQIEVCVLKRIARVVCQNRKSSSS